MPFEPEDIAGAVAVWVADDIAQSDGTAVAAWVDRISSFSAAQSNSSQRPTYRTTGINSQPAVDFDGSDDLLVYSPGTNSNPVSTASSGHVFAVYMPDSLAATGVIWSTSDTASNTRYLYNYVGTDGKNAVAQNNDTTADGVNGDTVMSTATAYLIETSSNSSAWSMRVDDTAQSLTTFAGSNTGDWFADASVVRDNFAIGAWKRLSEVLFANGKVALLVVVDGTISAFDRNALYDWLNTKYGFGLSTTPTLEPAVETDTAQPLNFAAGITVAVETDTGGALTVGEIVPIDRAEETDTAAALGSAIAIGAAEETDLALPVLPSATELPEWTLVLAERDGTVLETFNRGDSPEDAPVVAFRGQDPLNDVGSGVIALPVSASQLDEFVENRFVHLKSHGQTLTSMVVGATSETVLSPSGPQDQLADVALRSLMDVLNEGWVPGPGGFDVQPPGREIHFDFSHPDRDNSDFDPADEQGSVTDARAVYASGYGEGFAFPDDVQAIGPPGYTFATTDSHDGWCFVFVDHVFSATAHYRFRGVADNELTVLRVDSTDIQPKTWGFADAWQTDLEVTAGQHRVAAVFYNQIDPLLGAPHGVGTTNFALEVIKLDDAGNESDLELVTDSGWAIQAFPEDAPGMTFTQVAGICLTRNQDLGLLDDVVIDPVVDEFTDSNGAAIEQQWDITTRSWQPLGDFFLHEMGRYFCDIAVRADETNGGVIWYLYSLGGRGVVVGETIEPDEVEELRIDRERTAATMLAVEYQLGFTRLETTPPAGQPARGAFLSLGAQDTLAQVQRLGGPELADFARERRKVALEHVTVDGRQYWTGDSIDSLPVDRDLNTEGGRIMSMTFRLDDNGTMRYTPEFFDIMVPVPARASNALRRMGPGSAGGRAQSARST